MTLALSPITDKSTKPKAKKALEKPDDHTGKVCDRRSRLKLVDKLNRPNLGELEEDDMPEDGVLEVDEVDRLSGLAAIDGTLEGNGLVMHNNVPVGFIVQPGRVMPRRDNSPGCCLSESERGPYGDAMSMLSSLPVEVALALVDDEVDQFYGRKSPHRMPDEATRVEFYIS